MEKLLEFATSVPEFRRTAKDNIRHRLKDVIMLVILARISGCTGRADIIEFGRHNLTKFRSMGDAGELGAVRTDNLLYREMD